MATELFFFSLLLKGWEDKKEEEEEEEEEETGPCFNYVDWELSLCDWCSVNFTR